MSCIAVSVSSRSASGSTCRNVRPPGPSTVGDALGGEQPVLGLVRTDRQQVFVVELGVRSVLRSDAPGQCVARLQLVQAGA